MISSFRFFYFSGIFFVTLLFCLFGFYLVPVHATDSATVTVSLRENPEAKKFLQRGENVLVGFLDFELEGETIDIKRIALNLTGTADENDIRRAKLYTEWGTYIGSGEPKDDILSFSGLDDITLRNNEKKTIKIEVEISSTVKMGKTLGFLIDSTNSVHVESQKYDLKYVELGDLRDISPFVTTNESESVVIASVLPDPEYQTGIRVGDQVDFGTFRLEVFGENDVQIKQIVFQRSGAVSRDSIRDIVLLDANGATITDSLVTEENRIAFLDPIVLSAGSRKEFRIGAVVSENVSKGLDLQFEISNKWDIDAETVDTDVPVEVVGEFPLRTIKKTTEPLAVYMNISSENPNSRHIFSGKTNIILLEFTARSLVDDALFQSVDIDLQGTGTAFLKNIRLQKEDGIEISGSSASLNSYQFSGIGQQQAGQTVLYRVIADTEPKITGEHFVSVQISHKTDPIFLAEDFKNIPPSGRFPLTGSTVTLGALGSENSLSVRLLPGAKTIFSAMKNAPLATLEFKSDQENTEVESVSIAIEEGMSNTTLKNFKLMDIYGNVVTSSEEISGKTIVFSRPFPLKKGVTTPFQVFADIYGHGEESLVLSMSVAPVATGMMSGKKPTTVGDFPLITPSVVLHDQPDSVFSEYITYSIEPQVYIIFDLKNIGPL